MRTRIKNKIKTEQPLDLGEFMESSQVDLNTPELDFVELDLNSLPEIDFEMDEAA